MVELIPDGLLSTSVGSTANSKKLAAVNRNIFAWVTAVHNTAGLS